MINIVLGIIRTKFVAVLLGPAGIGLMGMYSTLISLVGTLAGMGIGSSGVRQIAGAAGSSDSQKIGRTIITIRRSAVVCGFLGMLLMFIFRQPLSLLTFGSIEYSWHIAFLSVTVFMSAVSGGQLALLQGMRRITDLASLSVIGGLLGTVVSIPLIYFLGLEGIVPSLIALAALSILTSWWYARRLPFAKAFLSWRETFQESKALLSLGIVFMITVLMAAAVMFFVRILVARQFGIESVGFYQTATTLSSLYIGLILNAMGMDFYPRLTAVAGDNVACNRMVNDQTEVGLYIATPGILATLTFAPYIIELFYSASFIPAYEVLRWEIMGVFLRVVSWPIAFILLAKGRTKILFFTELTANTVHVALVLLLLPYFGLAGTGMAFFGLYIFHIVMMLVVMKHVSNFIWIRTNMRLIFLTSITVALTFLIQLFAPYNIALTAGSVITLSSLIYSTRRLNRLVGPGWINNIRHKLKTRFS